MCPEIQIPRRAFRTHSLGGLKERSTLIIMHTKRALIPHANAELAAHTLLSIGACLCAKIDHITDFLPIESRRA